jgi:16S rRNA (uracil1498-N3)-methyltransferase
MEIQQSSTPIFQLGLMMRIHSFVAPEQLQKKIAVLSPEESHHLSRVLRVEPGQELTLFDGQGTRAEGLIEAVTKKEVTVRIAKRETVPPPAVEITLIQAVCKPDRFEMILQKATELGVRHIVPVVTANASLPAGKIEKMIERGAAIIRNAAQQCGTAWLPMFQGLEKWETFFPTIGKADVTFIGSLHPNAKPFKKAFEELREDCGSPGRFALPENTNSKGGANRPGEPNSRVALLIGPEGDFTEEEVNAAVEAGAIPVTFGTQILRTETAAIFGLSVLAYELF